MPGASAGAAAASGPVDAPSVEAGMLVLLNRARADAHLEPVAADDALAAVARGHSADMLEHGFFGHVSPTRGTTEDRLRAAHLLYPLIGENVARADSAQRAYDMLMASPAHRDVMLGAELTHVGIGAAVGAGVSRPDVFVTLEFASEHPVALEDVPRFVQQATDLARLPHSLPRLQLDGGLSDAARQAIGVLASDPTATQRALEAARAASARVRTPAPATCIVIVHSADMAHLEAPLSTQDAGASRFGVAAMHEPEGPESFTVVLVVQAGPKASLTCK